MSSFFRAITGTLIGIAAGFLFGPGAFSATAYAIGSLIGGFLFNKPQGPALHGLPSLNINGNRYGSFVPIVYGGDLTDGTKGGFCVSGNVIDAATQNAIVEERSSDKIEWFLTWAIQICDCTDGVERIVDKVEGVGSNFSLVLFERGSSAGFQLTLDPTTGMESGIWPGDSAGAKMYLSRGTGTQTCPPEFATLHGGTGCPYRWQTVVWLSAMFIGNTNMEAWQGQVPTIRAWVRDSRTGVREIIEAHLIRGGIPSDNIDVSNIPDTIEVAGAAQLDQGGCLDLVNELAAFAFCDIVHIGDQIKASDRTNPAIITVDAADLGAFAPGVGEDGAQTTGPARWFYTVPSQTYIPTRFTFTFIDPGLDWQQNTTTATRGFGESYNEQQFTAPIVLPFHQATQWAKRALDEAIAFGTSYKVVLPSKYIQASSGDVLNLPVDNGIVQVRITDQNLGAPGPLECDATSYDPGVYTDQDVADIDPRPIGGPPEYSIDVFIWDMNTARDADVTHPAGVLYAAATQPMGTTFKSVKITPNSSTEPYSGGGSSGFLGLGGGITFNKSCTSGVTVNALEDWTGGANEWDTVSSVQIQVDGTLSSTTIDEILANNANFAALQSGNGWEILYFLNATPLSVNDQGQTTYQLDTFLRVQRGTEAFGTGHDGADQFFLLDDAVLTLQLAVMPPRGTTLHWTRADILTDVSCLVESRSLLPWRVVDITATRDGSNNFTGQFSKRSKYTDLSDHTGQPPVDAPNDEDVFEIDIIVGGVAVRTIRTSSTATDSSGAVHYTFAYSAADQTSDGLTPGDPVTVRIYQLNSVVGRGYAAEATL